MGVDLEPGRDGSRCVGSKLEWLNNSDMDCGALAGTTTENGRASWVAGVREESFSVCSTKGRLGFLGDGTIA